MCLARKSKFKTALDWLLEENQPSIRYFVLTQMLDRSENDPAVQSTKRMITEKGWAADILSQQQRGGWWIEEESLYRPKYISTNWILLILSDLGLTKADPRIKKACELWIKRFAKKDGGFANEGMSKSHLCMVGNTARALEVRLHRASESEECLRVACEESGQQRRLVLFWGKRIVRLMGRHERFCCMPKTEMD